jgi:hypothetical protein
MDEPRPEPEFTTYTEDPYASGAENPTVKTSEPTVTLGSGKAVAAGATGTAVAFLSALGVAMPGGVTGEEWVAIALATVIGMAAAFGITWATPTKVTFNS